MTDQTTSNQGQPAIRPTDDNQKGIQNHRNIASHLEAAAKLHLEAAEHHEAGSHEKAALSTVAAQGYFSLAGEGQKEDVKYHALRNG